LTPEKKDFAAEDGHTGLIEAYSGRRRPGDVGELVRAGRCSVRHPQPGHAALRAVEQHLAVEDCKVARNLRGLVTRCVPLTVPFAVHNPDPPSNSTWLPKTVRSLGASPEVPAISNVPATEPFVTHNPDWPLASTPSNTASPPKLTMLLGDNPEVFSPEIRVNSKVPPAVPYLTHRPWWPFASTP
jgi:hypothetical protein